VPRGSGRLGSSENIICRRARAQSVCNAMEDARGWPTGENERHQATAPTVLQQTGTRAPRCLLSAGCGIPRHTKMNAEVSIIICRRGRRQARTMFSHAAVRTPAEVTRLLSRAPAVQRAVVSRLRGFCPAAVRRLSRAASTYFHVLKRCVGNSVARHGRPPTLSPAFIRSPLFAPRAFLA